jgi:hypothetical protein
MSEQLVLLRESNVNTVIAMESLWLTMLIEMFLQVQLGSALFVTILPMAGERTFPFMDGILMCNQFFGGDKSSDTTLEFTLESQWIFMTRTMFLEISSC